MASTKVEFNKFNGNTDFNLWEIKMCALLVQQGLVEALEGNDSFIGLTEAKKMTLMSKAHRALVLSLGDKARREISKGKIVDQVWRKLDEVYLKKSLQTRLYLKQKLYSFKMIESRALIDQIDEFDILVDDVENIEVILDDEDKTLLLLNSLSRGMRILKIQ